MNVIRGSLLLVLLDSSVSLLLSYCWTLVSSIYLLVLSNSRVQLSMVTIFVTNIYVYEWALEYSDTVLICLL